MTNSRFGRLVDQTLEASVVGSFTTIGPALRRRLEHWEPYSSASGSHMVITGATSGLGLKAAELLLQLGANVHLVGRNPKKLSEVLSILQPTAEAHGGSASGYVADLALLADTKALMVQLQQAVPKIDVLIHNAGALLADYTETPEGVEQTLAVHVLSPELLTRGLHTQLAAATGQVITMTSGGLYSERFNLDTLEMTKATYKGTVAYARAKRAQTLLTMKWNEDFEEEGVRSHLVHPGWADTPGVDASLPLFSKVMGPLLRSPEEGVDTLVWLATSAATTRQPGQLWLDRLPRPLHKLRRTRLTADEEARAKDALLSWCEDRIARALSRQS